MNAKQFWNKWLNWIDGKEMDFSEEEIFFQELMQAHKEWIQAQRRIDFLSDPDLIDHAIYVLEAAEKKYSFYIRKAKQKGFRVEIPYSNAV